MRAMVNSYGARRARSPHMLPSWTLFQLAGVLAALLFFLRTAPTAQRPAFVAALPFLAGGALALDWLSAVAIWAIHGARGVLPRPGGIVAYGALFGFVVVYATITKLRRQDVAAALDTVIAPLLLVVAFGRVGCFFAGCEPGCALRGPCGLTRHPVALYEVAAALVALAVTRMVRRERFAAGALVYATLRIVVECFRVHDAGMRVSAGQWTSLFVIGAAAAWLTRSPRRPPRLREPRPLAPS
jgi:phosphatidylglycerol:prolipoprotein diacylglycerol transferase